MRARDFFLGVLAGSLVVSMLGFGCKVVEDWVNPTAEAQQFYPSNPYGTPPTPQQQWNDQRTQQLFQQFLQQQLQKQYFNGLPHDPC